MLTKPQIDLFYNDLGSLSIKFPVAEINRRTGFNKGVISEVLNKKKEPSENFIDAFYREFKKELDEHKVTLTTITTKPNFGEEKPVKPNDDLIKTIASQQETIKTLTEAIAKLITKVG